MGPQRLQLEPGSRPSVTSEALVIFFHKISPQATVGVIARKSRGIIMPQEAVIRVLIKYQYGEIHRPVGFGGQDYANNTSCIRATCDSGNSAKGLAY